MKHPQTMPLRPKNRNQLYSLTQLYCSYRWFFTWLIYRIGISCWIIQPRIVTNVNNHVAPTLYFKSIQKKCIKSVSIIYGQGKDTLPLISFKKCTLLDVQTQR